MSALVETTLEQGGSNTEMELRRLRSAAIASHQRMAGVRQWQRSRKAYLGMLYSDVEIASWKSRGVHPKLWEVVQRMVAVLADRNPRFWPRPRGPENAELSAVMQSCADYEWDRQVMQSAYVLAARTLLIYGNAFFYTGVYPGLRDDDLYTQVFSPDVVFPDPSATNDSDLSYVWLHSRPSKSEIVKMFGRKVAKRIFDEVSPSALGPVDGFRDSPDSFESGSTYGTIGTASSYAAGEEIDTQFLSPTTGRIGTDARYDLWEGWLNEDAEIELEDDGDEFMVSMPKGRKVILIGDRYFPDLDMDNPFRHGQIPLSQMSCEQLLGEYFGQGRLVPLIDSAEQLADIDNLVLNNARLMLNAVWRVPTSSGLKITSFYPYPGMVIPYEGDRPPEPVPPPALPDYVFQLRSIKQQEFDNASGVSDISRGQFEGGLEDVSGKAVGRLIEPMLTQLRPIARNMGQGISRWGYQTVCNAIQFWEDARWRRILPEPLASIPVLPFAEIRDSDLPFTLLPDLRMEEGSTLPSDRDRRASQAFNLYDRAAFGPPGSPGAAKELLEALEYPNGEEIAGALAEFQMQNPPADPNAPNAAAPPAGGGGVMNKALDGEPPAMSQMAVEAEDQGQEVPL